MYEDLYNKKIIFFTYAFEYYLPAHQNASMPTESKFHMIFYVKFERFSKIESFWYAIRLYFLIHNA